MPKFILVMCVLQVLVHFLKTPNREILYLQFDPIRRHELWRFLTPCLIHAGQGDDENGSVNTSTNYHLWLNVFGQIYFGWRLEFMLKWKHTALVYFSSVLFGSLFSSALNPCSYSTGASGAVFGLMISSLSEHFMTRSKCFGLSQEMVWIYDLRTLSCSLAELLFLPLVLPGCNDAGIGDAVHIGGAFGGFLMSIFVWHSYTPRRHRRHLRRRKSLLKKFGYLIAVVSIVATVSANILYFRAVNKSVLASTLLNMAMELHWQPFSYETQALTLCNILWYEGNETTPQQ